MEEFGLVALRCEIWAGFIFVNCDPEAPPLLDYMGQMGAGIADYPFEKLTQVHKYRAEIGSNWKLFIDAFMEFYHAPEIGRASCRERVCQSVWISVGAVSLTNNS